ncbi:MAG: hypothetical protein OXM87_05775 [Truepera sp.]|nr:hypothetical protein [Truepera sp.]
MLSPDSLPRYWLAVTDDGVSFMDLEERDVIAAAVAHLDALDANPEEARWQLFESPEEEMARVGKRVVDYLRSLQAIEASAGSGRTRSRWHRLTLIPEKVSRGLNGALSASAIPVSVTFPHK